MAKDPAIETGLIDGAEAPGGIFLRNIRNRDPELQQVDARLRQAVLEGDENFVRGRLGSDRILSEAEILLIIKTRREAEENVKEVMAAAQAAEKKADIAEEEKISFNDWVRRYVASRTAASAQEKEVKFFLDASGRDPYGDIYYGGFGYDAQGVYTDSYRGKLGKDDIYRDQQGGEGDLRRGLYTLGKDSYNDQTGETIVWNEQEKKYFLVRNGADGKPIPESMTAMTQEERDQKLEEWRNTNRRLTDEEMAQVRRRMEEHDLKRKAAAEATPTARGGDPDQTAVHSENTSADGVKTRSDQTTAPHPEGNPGQELRRKGTSSISEARAMVERQLQQGFTYRNANVGKQNQRRDARTKDSDYVAGEASDAEKTSVLESAIYRVEAPSYVLGDSSRPVAGKGWVKDKDGGIWDDKGGYYDKMGGYWDKQGGYYDRDGNYTDQYGGFRAKDGSYMDLKGNFVDKDGNLWLAGNNGDTPDYPAKKGVNYIDVIAKHNEARYDEITKANPGLTDDDVDEIQVKLLEIEKDFRERNKPKPPSEVSSFLNAPVKQSAASVPDATQTDANTSAAVKRQPTVVTPKMGG